MQQLLVIEDNYRLNKLFANHLRTSGFDARCVSSITEAVVILIHAHSDLVVIDLDGFNQTDIHRLLTWVDRRTPLVVMATPGNEMIRLLQPDRVLMKPVSPRVLSQTVMDVAQAQQVVSTTA